MSGRFNPKWIIGRTIVACEMNPQPARDYGSGSPETIFHTPVITLDNGATLMFDAEETDFNVYGVNIDYLPPKRGRK